KKDDIKKPGILRKIKKFAGITLLSASIMLTTNCATNKALMYAARDGRTEIVKSLLEKDIDVNAKDKWGWTALMYAARDGRTEIVKLLLEKGADVNAKDILGLTALRYAAENGHKDVVELLKKAGGH
ncbi:MAG: ankyrin repeat domain-containing protein, partial [Candidatus Micrarchaeia archaeon]